MVVVRQPGVVLLPSGETQSSHSACSNFRLILTGQKRRCTRGMPKDLRSHRVASAIDHCRVARLVAFGFGCVLRRAQQRRRRRVSVVARCAARALRVLPLGSSGLQVTDVCLGTMTWGVQNTESDGHDQMDYAFKERGINFMDTAEMYPVPGSAAGWKAGLTEKIVGSWFEKNPCWRSEVILATKVTGFQLKSKIVSQRTVPPGPIGDARLDASSIKAACEASLRRLRTDYVDLYQLHWPERYSPNFGTVAYDPTRERLDAIAFADSLGAVLDLIREGKVRHWGLSNETAYGVSEWARVCHSMYAPMPASIQNPFSLLNRDFEGALAECCAPSHHNIGLLPWSPLCGGVLTGKYADGERPVGSRRSLFPWFQKRFSHPAVLKVVSKYQAIADECGLTLAQLALQWCQSRWFVSSTIVGATTMDQLRENIDAFDGHRTPGITQDVLDAVDSVHQEFRNPCDIAKGTSMPGWPRVPGR